MPAIQSSRRPPGGSSGDASLRASPWTAAVARPTAASNPAPAPVAALSRTPPAGVQDDVGLQLPVAEAPVEDAANRRVGPERAPDRSDVHVIPIELVPHARGRQLADAEACERRVDEVRHEKASRVVRDDRDVRG